MTNPFERGSSGPSPFGQGASGSSAPGFTPVRPPAPPSQGAVPSRPSAAGSGRPSVGENAIDTQDLNGRLRKMQKASDGLQAARERLASLTGTGTAADGKVKVTWASATGLDQLQLEPRAMRMASEELAAAIKQAIADAIADLRRQTAETLQQEAGISTRGGAKRVEEMREAFNGQMDEISNRIHDAKRAMERALMR